jgi:hypothetical protein
MPVQLVCQTAGSGLGKKPQSLKFQWVAQRDWTARPSSLSAVAGNRCAVFRQDIVSNLPRTESLASTCGGRAACSRRDNGFVSAGFRGAGVR